MNAFLMSVVGVTICLLLPGFLVVLNEVGTARLGGQIGVYQLLIIAVLINSLMVGFFIARLRKVHVVSGESSGNLGGLRVCLYVANLFGIALMNNPALQHILRGGLA